MKLNPILDAGGIVLLGAVFSHWLPPIAALLGAVWYALQIFDWINRWFSKRGK